MRLRLGNQTTSPPRSLLLLLIALLAAGCGGSDSAPAQKDGHYRNDRVRFRFDYPASWRTRFK